MSYIALRTDGNGFCSITNANQSGLNMGLSDFMIEGWVKTSSTQTQTIMRKEAGGIYYYCRIEATTGHLRLKIDDGGGAKRVEGDTNITDGQWHYAVVVVDRSSATGLKLLIDGLEESYISQHDATAVGTLDNSGAFFMGSANAIPSQLFIGLFDEWRIWNFGKDGLPADYAAYITWRAAGRNRFLDISEYDSGSWNLYADAVRTDLHNGTGTVSGMVVGERYGYESATPHTLDYQGGTLDDDGVFTATHTTGTIASGDADDHVWRVGLVARYRFEGDYTDETSNGNDLTAGGTGNVFLGYTLKKRKIISPYLI